jgi:hypothetical protein
MVEIDVERAKRRKQERERLIQAEHPRLLASESNELVFHRLRKSVEAFQAQEQIKREGDFVINPTCSAGIGLIFSSFLVIGRMERSGRVRFDDYINPQFYLEMQLPLDKIREAAAHPPDQRNHQRIPIKGCKGRHFGQVGKIKASIDAVTFIVYCHDIKFTEFNLEFQIPKEMIEQ